MYIFLAKLAMGVIVSILPLTASSQEVLVRSGDHEDFTRIVFDFDDRPAWQFGRSSDKYELRLNSPEIIFNLSDVFRRIGNDRISSIEDLGQGRLTLKVNCDCTLDVRQLPNDGLMVDVRDGRPEEDNPWEIPLEKTVSSNLLLLPSPGNTILPVVFPTIPQGLTIGPLAETPEIFLTRQNVQRIERMKNDLIEQTARAAAQGLISFDISSNTLSKKNAEDAQAEIMEPTTPVSIPSLTPNILIETQVDRDIRALKPTREGMQATECIAAAVLDVGSWYELESVRHEIGPARMNLVDTRGRADPRAHEELAKMLIFLSFGREAKTMLMGGPSNIPNSALLLEMANIMDEQTLPPSATLAGQLNCNTLGAVWAALAFERISPLDDVNTVAIVRGVSAMPKHLRQFLGPKIAAKLMDFGDEEAALQIRNAIQRGEVTLSSDSLMLDATLDLSAGNSEEAQSKLVVVAESRSHQAALALATLMENRMAQQQIVASDLIEQAAALAFELKGSDGAVALTEAMIRAQVYNSEYDRALDLVVKASSEELLMPEAARRFRTLTLSRLASEADDTEFLQIALRETALQILEDPARLAVAARFLSLGMPGPARSTLGTRADIPVQEERYVLAEIAILEGKPSIAESYLTGLDTSQANALRERAIGLVVPVSGGEIQDPAISNEDFVAPSAESVLARNRDLLTGSRAIRDNLLSLLGKIEN